jgi:hypothetical protein
MLLPLKPSWSVMLQRPSGKLISPSGDQSPRLDRRQIIVDLMHLLVAQSDCEQAYIRLHRLPDFHDAS